MPTLRGQMFFEDLGSVGWSETYWNLKATSMSEMADSLLQLLKPRVKMLGSNSAGGGTIYPTVKYLRVEDIETKNVTVNPPVPQWVNNAKQRQISSPEVPWSTVFYRLDAFSSPNQIRATRLLSGVPQSDIVDPSTQPFDPNFAAAFATWSATLTNANNGWALPQSKYSPVAGGIIVSVTRNADGSLTISTTGDPSPGNDQFVLYLRDFTPRQWNGPVSLIRRPLPATNVFDTFNKIFVPVGTRQTNGTLNTRSIQLVQIVNCVIRGETHRARGRVFGQSRGRRTVRRTHP